MKTYKVELTEEFIEKAHEVACDEWKTKIKDLVPEAFKDKFEVGKWYRHHIVSGVICYQGYRSGYGFDQYNNWEVNHEYSFDIRPQDWKPATDKEVKEALIKEAKKIGLVYGAKVRCLYDKKVIILSEDNDDDIGFHFDKELNQLWFGYNIKLFEDGEWANSIENPTTKRIKEIEAELKQLKEKL